MWIRGTVIGVVIGWPAGVALACSGPGAMHVIDANIRRGWIMFAIAAAMVVAAGFAPAFRQRGMRSLWPLLVLLVIHPGLWMSGRSGDCGMLLRSSSTVMTFITPVAILLGYAWVRRRQRIIEDRARS
ncbi:MAG: hypothetical protein M3680_33840 [Myxococcota bacterium]|nr:hypothetical protein [Myxococcota bacterium]